MNSQLHEHNNSRPFSQPNKELTEYLTEENL